MKILDLKKVTIILVTMLLFLNMQISAFASDNCTVVKIPVRQIFDSEVEGIVIRAVHRQRAGGDPVHTVHRAQQRGLTRAGAADDGDELAVLNGQVYIVKAHGAVGIYLGYMVKYDHTVSSSS